MYYLLNYLTVWKQMNHGHRTPFPIIPGAALHSRRWRTDPVFGVKVHRSLSLNRAECLPNWDRPESSLLKQQDAHSPESHGTRWEELNWGFYVGFFRHLVTTDLTRRYNDQIWMKQSCESKFIYQLLTEKFISPWNRRKKQDQKKERKLKTRFLAVQLLGITVLKSYCHLIKLCFITI